MAQLDHWFAAILGLLTAATIVLEVVLVDAQTTSTEISLFGILQFVFSIGFAWVLSRASFRAEFQKEQKRFAIAAYRRVREIERTVNRLLGQVDSQTSSVLGEEGGVRFEGIRQAALGIQDTIRSSIADWADVIGEEISALERIEELRSKQQIEFRANQIPTEATRSTLHDADSRDRGMDLAGRTQPIDREASDDHEIKELLSSLPAELQVLERGRQDTERRLWEEQVRLDEEMSRYGCLALRAFWERRGGFDRSIKEVPLEEGIELSVNDAGSRTGVLIVHDSTGKRIGVVTNCTTNCDYPEFVEVIFRVLKASRIKATLLQVEGPESDSKRIYFTVRVLPKETVEEKRAPNNRRAALYTSQGSRPGLNGLLH
jgi:hypothetical protein